VNDLTTTERAPRDELARVQLPRLQQLVARAAERVPFHRERLRAAGVTAADIRSLSDLDRLPFKLRVGFFGAEPWTEGMRETLEKRLNIMALNVYGLSEVIGPGVSVECPERRGMHVAEDHFLPEIQVPDVEPHYLLVLRRDGTLDTHEVQVEACASIADSGCDSLVGLSAIVRRKIHEVIGLTADVSVVPPKTIERSVGKAKRVLDLRQAGR
jgi:phenylacetate-coenzyme A ligase PaaK-like adenylate-forming protein